MNARHRQRGHYPVLLAITFLLVAGCLTGDDKSVTGPAGEQATEARGNPPTSGLPALPPPPPPSPPPANDSAGGESDAARGEQQTPAEPPVLPSSTPPAPQPPIAPPSTPPQPPPPEVQPPAGQPSIRLSTGVALPQTGPTGTMMGFSVDYQFSRGQPARSSQYVWVIERADGQSAKFMVRLSNKNTLQVFVPKWRPEDGPFQSHIEDSAGKRLSESISLR